MHHHYNKRLLAGILLVGLFALLLLYSVNDSQFSNGIKAIKTRMADMLQNGNTEIAGGRAETEDNDVRSSARWVVMALAVSGRMSMNYAFCIPFAVASWQRIGWKTTILIFGDTRIWQSSPVLLLVQNITQQIDQSVKFRTIPVRSNPVSYAQVGRLFVTAVTPWILPDDIVLTSDVDILPLNKSMYDEVNGTEIFILNADCCGRFTWANSRISMQPMTSIGTTLNNWRSLMEIRRLHDNETLPEYMNMWLQSHYGKRIANKNVRKGGNEEWYMDQRVVSIQIHKSSMKIHKIYTRKKDRVNRGTLEGWSNFTSRKDCHMYHPSFSDKFWPNTQKLVSEVFTGSTNDTLISFKRQFVEQLSRKVF